MPQLSAHSRIPSPSRARSWARSAAAPGLAVAALVLGALNLRLMLGELVSGRSGPGALGEDFWTLYAPAAALPSPLYRSAVAQLAAFAADPQPVAVASYPPIAFVLVRVLTVLAWLPALAVWLALSLASVALAWWLATRAARSTPAGGAWALLAFCAPATWWAFHEGQVNLVLLPLLAGAALAADRRRATLAGGLVGVAAAVKGYPLLLAIHFAWRRDWRGLAACAVTFAVLTIAGFALTWPGSLAYVTDLLPVQMLPSPGFVNHGLPAVARRYFEPNIYGSTLLASEPLAILIGKILPLGLIAASLLGARGLRPSVPLLALSALLPLLTTTSWMSTVVLATPTLAAGAAVAAHLRERGRAGKLCLAAGALLTQVSPLLRALEVSYDSMARAVAQHDQLFYAWNLDLTLGYIAIWAGWLLVARADRDGAQPVTTAGSASRPEAAPTSSPASPKRSFVEHQLR